MLLSSQPAFLTFGTVFFSLSHLATATHWVINNTCPFPVTIWHVVDTTDYPVIVGERSYYYETLGRKSDMSGPAVKISITGTQEVVAQLEYTVGSNRLFYSHINGHPFLPHGIELRPSIGHCKKVDCDAAQAICPDAYHTPYDNWATFSCDPKAYLTVDLCV